MNASLELQSIAAVASVRIVSLILIFAPACVVNGAHVSDELLKAIEIGWRKQQDAVKAASFELGCTQIRSTSPSGIRGTPQSRPLPPTRPGEALESSYREHISFLGLAGCSRIATNRPILDVIGKDLKAAKMTTVFDGEQHARALASFESWNVDEGQIYPPETGNLNLPMVHYKPVFFAFRALQPAFGGISVEELRGTTSSAAPVPGVDGDLVVLDIENRQWLLDPARNFVCTQYIVKNSSNVIRGELKVMEYLRDQSIWVPLRWEYTLFSRNGDGHIDERHRYKVDRWVLNPPLTVEDFRLEFGPNTVVTATDNLNMRNDTYTFIDDNGRSHIIDRAMWRRIREEGSRAFSGTSDTLSGVFLVTVALLSAVALWAVWRKFSAQFVMYRKENEK